VRLVAKTALKRPALKLPIISNPGASGKTAQTNQKTQLEVRRDQLNADIKAREERNNLAGGDAIRADADLEAKFVKEANLPASQLAVEAEEGAVIVSGTVPTQEQLGRLILWQRRLKASKV